MRSKLAVAALTVAALSFASTAYSWAATTWPGGSTVAIADSSNVFGKNLSGLSFQSPTALWAVKNGPGTIYKLAPNGAIWSPGRGKPLHYSNGKGDPDAEGVVVTPDGLLVATERDNSNDNDSLLKVLRFDPSSSASSLNATGEWNLTSDLPDVDANSGLEGISWIPDSFLTAHGFRDEHSGTAYAAASYPGHGSGLYFVALEGNGIIYAYALNQSGSSFTRVATISSGFPALMELEFDGSRLWAVCDNSCQGQSKTLELDGQGRFAVTATYSRPSGMANLNNEGFAIGTCTGDHKTVLWSDDDNTSKHALRRGTLPCAG